MNANFKLNRARLMMSAATGIALVWSGASFAYAQEDDTVAPAVTADTQPAEDDRTLDVVVVTGIRSSIENSLLTKRNETSIVEAISAE
ncbi:MAG: hypothetical protein KJ961_07285, partial [Alphaproteobacteria bacterium]|nr:hypothetical protein [Alphaproteobacteria bacterium]